MVYANDQWVQLPTKDLYDSQIMAMAINAAKDMYEKGQEEIKDFNKLYGDFYTPIIGDQSKYDEEVIQPVRNVINAIYAAGGDPLRSPEARSLISRAIYNIDPKRVALFRQRAENAKEYYKNLGALKQKDLYNEDFSRFLREDPTQWADNYAGISSPTAYDDLNSHTQHWFDKVNRDAYLYTDDNGYEYTGIRPEDLKAVMDYQIPDFISTGYGKYQMELAKRQLGPEATDQEVMDRLYDNIVSANKELTINPKRELSDEKKLELQDKYKARDAARDFYYKKELYKYEHPDEFDSNGNRIPGSPTKTNGEYDSAEGLFYRGLIHSGGAEGIDDPNVAVGQARDNIIDRQLNAFKQTKGVMSNANAVNYMIDAASIEESPENFAQYLGRPVADSKTGAVYTVSGDDRLLYTADYITSNQYGLHNKYSKLQHGGEDIEPKQLMVPTTKVPTVFFKNKDGQYEVGQLWEVDVYDTDDEGVIISAPKRRYMELPSSREITYNMPSYGNYVNYKKTRKSGDPLDSKYRPNISVRQKTKGLKNTGSQNVNVRENTPSNIGFAGTLNPEAMRM